MTGRVYGNHRVPRVASLLHPHTPLRVPNASNSPLVSALATCSLFEARSSWELPETGAVQKRKYCTVHQPSRQTPTGIIIHLFVVVDDVLHPQDEVRTHSRTCTCARCSHRVCFLVTARFASSPISSKALSTDLSSSTKHPVTAPSVSSPASVPRATAARSSPSQGSVLPPDSLSSFKCAPSG